MHIALKKIKIDLQRFLSKGSEEQIVEIYEIVRNEYLNTEIGKSEINSVPDKKPGRPKKMEIIE